MKCIHCGESQMVQIGKPPFWVRECISSKGHQTAEKYALEGGSTRSEKAPAHHLVPGAGLRRISARFGLGAEIHGEGNWQKSIHESESSAGTFCREAFNHMIEHAFKMTVPLVGSAAKEPADDHLGAIGWAVCAIAYAESVWGKKWTEFSK